MSSRTAFAVLAVVLAFQISIGGAATDTLTALNPARVAEIAKMLPEQPAGPGQPISNRAVWDARRTDPEYGAMVKAAEKLLRSPIPDQPDDLFLDYSRTGNRERFQGVAGSRRSRLAPLVLAECVENRGRFIPALQDLLTTLCVEKTWVLPAHDAKLVNFYGKEITNDLASSAMGWELSLADYLVGEKLAPTVRGQLRHEIHRRIIEPCQDMIRGKRKPDRWFTMTNNWNAVCLCNVTGAGLIQIQSRDERAEFVAAAEQYITYFLSGFTPDGYCSEGLGYWNYGYGHFALLAENVRLATGGKIDMLYWKQAYEPALFGARIQIIGGVSPAFADAPVEGHPAQWLMWLLNHRLGLGLEEYAKLQSAVADLSATMIFAEVAKIPAKASTGTFQLPAKQLRTWFDVAGIYIGRPRPRSACKFGVALKGGNNAENHNHNDVGSYTVVNVDRPVLLDPGSEVYTKRTFGAHRYESNMLNSYGHPVPVVAGQLQRTGAAAKGVVLKTEFTTDLDRLVFDIKSAYKVPELSVLERTFEYSRTGKGAFVVSDRIAFKNPQSYATALITLGKMKQIDSQTLLVTDRERSVRVKIDTGGVPFDVKYEEIKEEAHVKPFRIGINLKQPITKATVTLRVTPE